MNAICVIPARLESTRLRRKLLKEINGKPLIQYVYENAKKAKKPSRVMVACDDDKLMEAVKRFKGECLLTSAHHHSGTERLTEAAAQYKADVFVNVQADEPLMDPSVIDDLISAMEADSTYQMATACVKLRDEHEFHNPNVVKVVRNLKDEALYFSRAAIPHDRGQNEHHFFKHLGVYAYRRDFLLKIPALTKSRLEDREKLEQLRILDNGYAIKVLETAFDSIGVDTEEDFKKVEHMIKTKLGKATHA
ncbi:MAG: 3-deoxy-manno-octulosonate cytidylyltransferase [Candidatus Omnitrophica bacterium CG11_big_fil_rev_8_21_14_0_20_45_26]|uniref:3-deoxy-manno-octulosonate cytidylyltransferase n=1 Tax=Candidatus Abzuiibacterium crystallinum TaxID=1974748 RepID=A0A2H0LMR6_9BACT|nr:MAG: 3-deoxy-manno-octulosonate cytidylyltransferase [Candidatus Omnitrophica bacterium CG11_big_fil_rev_8_21_14_0_20_45_26]PIW65203.1 MAG: 3-deoxy-manno-octulosonate cytidylyltransferase [Candidatus Omnitrophica bacterium CG12_big_fil_rev_8_21_14_0_65_45_16]